MRKFCLIPVALLTLSFMSCAGSQESARSETYSDQATKLQMDETRRRVNDNQGSGPLGSQTNPIKCDGFDGAKAYLSKLRGPNGEKTTYEDMGSAGVGPFESLIYQYNVNYPTPGGSKQVQVFIDIDFADYSEGKAATGLSIR